MTTLPNPDPDGFTRQYYENVFGPLEIPQDAERVQLGEYTFVVLQHFDMETIGIVIALWERIFYGQYPDEEFNADFKSLTFVDTQHRRWTIGLDGVAIHTGQVMM